MKALVTGSAGFVGRHLVPKLKEAGYEVCEVDPLNETTEYSADIYKHRWSEHFTSLRNGDGIFNNYRLFDVVVHLAANIVNVDTRMKGGVSMYDDIELDLAMCRWLEKNSPSKCAVLMSSCAVDFPEDPYCIVKRNLEAMAATLHKKGVPVIVLRPFSGYGEDQSEEYPFSAILGRALRQENPLTVWGGTQVRDWIHIDDLTDAIMFSINNVPRSPQPIEVGTRFGTSLASLARQIARACEYSPEVAFDQSKSASSSRRVAGESGNACLQEFGWYPQRLIDSAILRAVEARRPVAV